jgi:hypothetical protein
VEEKAIDERELEQHWQFVFQVFKKIAIIKCNLKTTF